MEDTQPHTQQFDRLMEIVGNDGKFQKRYNILFNFFLCVCISMAFMNILLVLNEPDHWCHVPGRENTNFSLEEWRDRVLPLEIDNKGKLSYSRCNMYNRSISELLEWDLTEKNQSKDDEISCTNGYEYDKMWYKETVVSKEDWVCERTLYVTNALSFNRLGEVVGTFILGQLGDAIGRRPVVFLSIFITTLGRFAILFATSIYGLFVLSSTLGTMSGFTVFHAPMVVAAEICKGERRGSIAMYQCWGWCVGQVSMALIFWAVKDWTPFLILTTAPLLIGLMFPQYMIESPRWLAVKGKYKRCAEQLQMIANVNGIRVKITEELIKETLKNQKIEKVYGMASLFSSWRIAKNTTLMTINWVVLMMILYTLALNASKLDGNPFLFFAWQSSIELPAYYLGQCLGNRIGRRLTQALSFFLATCTCIPIIFIIQNSDYALWTSALTVMIKFNISINLFSINLQSMEMFPTCLRQTGYAILTVAANVMGLLGPFVVYLGTNYDVRYPYLIMGLISFVAAVSSLFIPETLGQQLPETLAEAKVFGRGQPFWSIPKVSVGYVQRADNEEEDARMKLNQPEYAP